MSVFNASNAIRRIKGADSRMAVFLVPQRRGHFAVVPADTAVTQRRIESGDPWLLGIFDKRVEPDYMRSMLAEV